MADPFAIIAIINTHRVDLEAALGPAGPAFFSRLDDLFNRGLAVAADMNAQASVGDELLALVDQYPGARAVSTALSARTAGRRPAACRSP